jgi:AcrR family transcriptional regulator
MSGFPDAVAAPAAPKPQVGRPRDPALDQAILRAVRDLLVERGYHALSVQEVTRRCGVHVRTITRRWNTKAALVAAAILGGDDPLFSDREVPIPPTGRLDRDLRQLVEISVRYLSEPATRAALPALVSEIATDDEVRERFERRAQEWTAMTRSVLEHAVASGDAPERILQHGRLLPNILSGTAFNLQWADPVPVDDALLDELTQFVLAALLAPART